MACYSPMIVECLDPNRPDLKKAKYKWLGKATDLDFEIMYGRDISGKTRDYFDRKYILVPCGNCIGCRLDNAETWADRSLVESFDKPSLFVTITYNDENLPVNSLGYSSIKKSDIDDFIVSLRNKFRNISVRYTCASEYGDLELRCHAHLIIFGLDLEEINPKFYKLNHTLSPMYTSSLLSDLWKGRGFVVVEEGNYFNMAYTSRYILKKQKGEAAAEYEAFDIEPPSFRCSNRPGIGHDWAINHLEELFTNGYVPISRSAKGTGKITPNRYFKKLAEKEDPRLVERWRKKMKEVNQDIFHEKLRQSSFTLDQTTKYNEFARQTFLKRTDLSRNNFT